MLLSPLVTLADNLDEDDTFTVNGITYKVTDTSPYEVAVGTIEYGTPAIDKSTTGELTLPSSVIGTDGNNYSVTSIGMHAFNKCSGLTSVTIPNSVKSIEYGAFSSCRDLTSVTIPNSVTSIGDYAFENCTSLPSITISNSVTNIGDRAFMGCSGLTSIVVEPENTVFDSRENCNAIIETASNALIQGCTNTVIPNSVTSIGGSAFSYSGLTSINIPNSVTTLGNYAFTNCI